MRTRGNGDEVWWLRQVVAEVTGTGDGTGTGTGTRVLMKTGDGILIEGAVWTRVAPLWRWSGGCGSS